MPRVLLLLEHVFMAWMLYDCYRRRPGSQWYWIIFIPFGEWFYFFQVKIHDPDMAWLKVAFRRRKPSSLESLRFRCEETPSHTNRLRLAQALHDAGELEDSAELFEQLLADDARDFEAIYGLARCQMGLADLDAAVDSFERLLEMDASFAEYEPWLDLVKTLWRLDRKQDALERLSALVETSPRLAHSVTLAEFQKEADEKDDARSTLQTALYHFEHAPKYFQKRNRMWAFRARRMLKTLG